MLGKFKNTTGDFPCCFKFKKPLPERVMDRSRTGLSKRASSGQQRLQTEEGINTVYLNPGVLYILQKALTLNVKLKTNFTKRHIPREPNFV